MKPTRSQFELSARTWIVTASELADDAVIFAGQPAPRPGELYITLQLIANARRGWPIKRVYDAPGSDPSKFEASVELKREPRVDVNIYGADHRAVAERLEVARWIPHKAVALQQLGLGISQIGEPQDFTRIARAGEQGPRTLIQFVFYASDLHVYDADVIETTAATIDPPF